jgi:hypothetical protein
VFLSLTRHGKCRRELAARLARPEFRHLTVVRLRSRTEVEAFVGTESCQLAP